MSGLLNRLSVRNRIWMIVCIVIGGVLLGGSIDVWMLRASLRHEKESTTRQLVESGYSVLEHFHDLQRQGRMDEASARAAAIATLRAMRYNGKDYFWLNDLGSPLPRMVMHPALPQVEGTILDGARFNCATSLRVGADGPFQSTDGKKNLTAAIIEVVTRGGHGYVAYDWPKPLLGGGSTTELYPKLSYVKKFAPWGWVIGSGIYVDDVDAAVRARVLHQLGWTAVIGSVLLLLAALIARSITRPLQITAEFMDHTGGSEAGLERRLPVEGNGEIARMARGCNAMLERIQARDAELARHQEHLEREVVRRTASLNEARQRAEQELAERKVAELALGESQARMHALLDASGETMLLMDPLGQILAINACGAERFHLRPDDMTGRNFFDYLPPDLAESRRLSVEAVVASGEPMISQDCRGIIRFSNSIYPVTDAAGVVTSVAVQAKDVTEQWRAEQVEDLFGRLDTMLLKWRMNMASIAQMFCDEVLPVFDLAGAWVGRAEKDGNLSLVAGTESMGPDFLGRLNATVLRWDTDEGCPLVGAAIRDGYARKGCLDEGACLACDFPGRQEDARSVLFLPLALRGETWGVLTLYGRERTLFDNEQLTLQLSTLGHRLGVTIDAALQQEWLSLLDSALAGVGNAVMITDGAGRILWANQAFAALSGYGNEEILGGTPRLFSSGVQDKAFFQQFWQTIQAGTTWQGDLVNARPDGSRYTAHETVTPLVGSDGMVSHFIAVLEDVSERRALEARIQHAANFDQLTDLPNRGLFFDRLGQALALARRDGQRGALLFLDLDHFKEVNDRFGHAAGDSVLVSVARRLREQVRESDTVARLAGDEFTVILPRLVHVADAARVAEKILAAIAAPMDVGGATATVGASIGVVIFPDHGETAESILQAADSAMYEAKRDGRSVVRVRELLAT